MKFIEEYQNANEFLCCFSPSFCNDYFKLGKPHFTYVQIMMKMVISLGEETHTHQYEYM